MQTTKLSCRLKKTTFWKIHKSLVVVLSLTIQLETFYISFPRILTMLTNIVSSFLVLVMWTIYVHRNPLNKICCHFLQWKLIFILQSDVILSFSFFLFQGEDRSFFGGCQTLETLTR